MSQDSRLVGLDNLAWVYLEVAFAAIFDPDRTYWLNGAPNAEALLLVPW